MSSPIDDKALEEYLSGKSQVSQRYRELQSDEVPAHLDDLVLSQARDAISDRAAVPDELSRIRNKRRRLMQWGIPAAVAASALLVVSIVIRSGVQHEVLELPKVRNTGPAPAAAPPMAAKAENSDATGNGVVLIAPPRDAVTEFSSLALSEEEKAAAARADHERAEQSRMKADAPAAQNYRARQEAAMQSSRSAAAVAAMPAPAPVPMIAPAQPAALEREHAEPKEQPEEDLQEIVATGYKATAATQRSGPHETVSPAGATSGELSATDQLHADPEQWLEHIRQLRRDDQNASADREWRAFRKQYPEFVVADTDPAREKN